MSDLKNKMTSFLKYPVYYPVLLNKDKKDWIKQLKSLLLQIYQDDDFTDDASDYMFEAHGYLTDGHAVKKSEDKLADCLKNLMSLLIEAKVPEGDIAVPKNESLKGMLDVLEEISAKNTILGSHVYLLYLMVAGFYSQIDTLFLSVRYGNVALSKEKYWSHAERSAIQVDYLCSNLWMFDPITNTSNEFSGIDFKKDKLEKIVSPLDQEYKQWSGIDSVIISSWPDKEVFLLKQSVQPNPSLEVHELTMWSNPIHMLVDMCLKRPNLTRSRPKFDFLYNICMNKNIGSRKDELAEQEVFKKDKLEKIVSPLDQEYKQWSGIDSVIISSWPDKEVEQRPHRTIVAWTGTVHLPHSGTNDVIKSHTHGQLSLTNREKQCLIVNGFEYKHGKVVNSGATQNWQEHLQRTAKTSFRSMEGLRLINEHVCRQSPNAFVRREVVARVKTAAMTEFGSSSSIIVASAKSNLEMIDGMSVDKSVQEIVWLDYFKQTERVEAFFDLRFAGD
uniref:Uncharacterized protein n=1 Tax=Ditylenchus dipsaci TaxID=166011 RepID=A0A915DN50_9BILA